MKSLPLLLISLVLGVQAAELSDVHSVYVLPMAHGMDQYLVNQLTAMHVLQVVTDPARADAVFTDRVGPALEENLKHLFPASAKSAAAKNDKNNDKTKDDKEVSGPLVAVNHLNTPGNMSSFGRAKGTVFLVDVKTRTVLWSTFQAPKEYTAKELHHTAGSITQDLQKALGLKPSK